jgi:hypothetical protein
MDTKHAPPVAVQSLEPEPRWPAIVAILATGSLFLFMPERLTFGPNWLLLAIVAVLTIPTILSRRVGNTKLNYWFGLS